MCHPNCGVWLPPPDVIAETAVGCGPCAVDAQHPAVALPHPARRPDHRAVRRPVADAEARRPARPGGTHRVRAALFNLRLAVTLAGREPVARLFRDQRQPLLLAALRLAGPYRPGEAETELHAAIAARHTNRRPRAICAGPSNHAGAQCGTRRQPACALKWPARSGRPRHCHPGMDTWRPRMRPNDLGLGDFRPLRNAPVGRTVKMTTLQAQPGLRPLLVGGARCQGMPLITRG